MLVHKWESTYGNPHIVGGVLTDPYIRKIKLVDYLNASLSQKKRKQNKFSILMDFEKDVGETKGIDERRE